MPKEPWKEPAQLARLVADVALALTREGTLPATLRGCADSLVRHLDAAFARIWTVNPQTNVLELQASAGLYTHLYGPHSRVPVGQWKIGRIAEERRPHLTNDVLNDPRISDHDWARREGMVAFAGHPLIVENRLIGVMAVFAREPLTDFALQAMATVADILALGIERMRVESTLRRNQQMFEGLFEFAPDAVVVVNDAGCIVNVNRQAEAMFGYDRRELLGKPVEWLMPEPARERHAVQRGGYFAEPRLRPMGAWLTLFGRHRDGGEFPMDILLSPLRLDDSTLVISVIRDITDRKRAEQELHDKNAQLLHSQKLDTVGRLAGGVAHDFNNLLTVIIGYAQFLRDGLPPDTPLRQHAEVIEATAQSAADLIRQLLAFSRRQRLEPKVLDLNAIIAPMEKMLRRTIGEHIELVTVPAPDLGRVKADPGQIEQVIMNLVINARDAMTSGGKLTIETTNVEVDHAYALQHAGVGPGSYILLAVSDTGCGMDAETQSHIFEPFFTTKEHGKGTGLGLATVYGIVKQSGGNIWVYSRPGHGTTFKIYLPRVNDPVEPPKPYAPPTGLRGGSETVLVVEDEEPVRALVASILRGHGYTVFEAAHGAEAIQISADYQGTIHLLLTDIAMRQMPGTKLADRLIPSRPGIKVLFMSGYMDEHLGPNGMLDQNISLIQKPFAENALLTTVRAILDPAPRARSTDGA